MNKLLSGTALALIVAAPVWAVQANASGLAEENTVAEQSGQAVIAQDADTQEMQDDEIPEVMESQPGVVTDEDTDAEDGTTATAPGSTGGVDEKSTGGTAGDAGTGSEVGGDTAGTGDSTGGGKTGGSTTGGGTGSGGSTGGSSGSSGGSSSGSGG